MVALKTAAELAAILNVHPRTVIDWANTGKIPAMRIGARTYRFDEQEVLKALKGLIGREKSAKR